MYIEIIGFSFAGIIMIGASVYVFVQLLQEVFNGKIVLSNIHIPVFWKTDKINFIKIVVIKLAIILFYSLFFLICYFKIAEIVAS